MEPTPILRKAIIAAGLMLLLIPGLALGQSLPAVEQHVKQHAAVSGLTITQSEGIILMRGRVTSRDEANRAVAAVRELGYSRVANLLELSVLPDDEAIQREAEREIYATRGLAGCRLHVSSSDGVLTVEGTVVEDAQKDLALRVLQHVDGVRSVQTILQRV